MSGSFVGLVVQIVLLEEDVRPAAFLDEGGCEAVGFIIEGDL